MYANLTSRVYNETCTGVVDTSRAHVAMDRQCEGEIENERNETPNIYRVKYVLPLIFNKENAINSLRCDAH